MRALLRNFKTGEYFQTATSWTRNHKEAFSFENHDTAMKVARDLRLQNIDLCLVGGGGEPLLGTRLDIDPRFNTQVGAEDPGYSVSSRLECQ